MVFLLILRTTLSMVNVFSVAADDNPIPIDFKGRDVLYNLDPIRKKRSIYGLLSILV
jgi:hypothetical protein